MKIIDLHWDRIQGFADPDLLKEYREYKNEPVLGRVLQDNVHIGNYYQLNGERHRIDGPAIELFDEYAIKEEGSDKFYWLFGIEIKNLDDFLFENDFSWPLTYEDEILFKLRYK